ncbi:hypothetical protein Pmani_039052 [Petrolisthes manimaculis]|uniref:Protein prenyltransferase alpha subunit repeat-containing protein 1 n=1 Tax=Petrolisthes manimaculis TaxID=1843537 RepID=A0AAE1NEY1_9EUCA|nr:hypothetical protein Pmani_039052 [Petrolisthes manimaculis]
MEEATCERIVKKIDMIISRDPHLDEFDIVFALGEVNRSPVITLGHKLGLESWCVKHVYAYAYAKILHARKTKRHHDPAVLFRWTQFCLLIAPEVATFWNMRKMMLRQGLLSADTDLLLTKLILSRKPKCMEVFQHRKWLYTNIIAKALPHQANGAPHPNQDNQNGNFDHLDSEFMKEFLFSEFELCGWTSEKHQNNYHSWNHRLWVLQQFAMHGDLAVVYRSEYETSHCWVSRHVSEHSGLHYLQYLIDSLASLVKEGKIASLQEVDPSIESIEKLYLRELEFNRDLIEEYHDHEALFCHRRFLLLRLRDLLYPGPQRTSTPPPPALKRWCVETVNSEWSAVLLGERALVNSCINTNSYQKTLGEKHTQWLNNILAI